MATRKLYSTTDAQVPVTIEKKNGAGATLATYTVYSSSEGNWSHPVEVTANTGNYYKVTEHEVAGDQVRYVPSVPAGTSALDLAVVAGTQPASALTANVASTVDGTYGTEEQDVLAALRTRVLEIEAILKRNGLLAP